MKKNMLVLLCGVFYSLSSHAVDFAIDAHAGLMGTGFGGTVGINRYINVRGGLNSLEADADFSEDDLDYTADLEFDNQYLFLDYHPFAGSFRLTAGFYNNNNGFNGRAISNVGAELGDAADVINLPTNSRVDIEVGYEDSIAPYIGIGFGNAVRNGGGFGFSVDLGVVMTGNFEVDVSLDQATRDSITGAPGSTVTSQDIDDAIAAEIAEVENNDDFKDIDAWPLLQIGISYGF